MAIFDPVIFDGTTGGAIFDDGGIAPPPPPPIISQTLSVQLARIELQTELASTETSVNIEGIDNG